MIANDSKRPIKCVWKEFLVEKIPVKSKCPMKYYEIQMLLKSIWEPVIERLGKRIYGWKTKYFTNGGKIDSY